jgi:hypothetical protein
MFPLRRFQVAVIQQPQFPNNSIDTKTAFEKRGFAARGRKTARDGAQLTSDRRFEFWPAQCSIYTGTGGFMQGG